VSNLVKFSGGGLPTNANDLVAGLANVRQEISGSSGLQFLRLLKDGHYAIGAENLEPEEDSLWAANPFSIHHGFAAWGDGELYDEVMVPFNQALPLKSELRDYGVKWDKQFSVILQCVEGTDKGLTILYKGTSVGLQNAFKTLIDALLTRAQSDPDTIVPVIALETDSYVHKKYGKIYTPVLEIVDWISMSGEDAEPEDDDDDDGKGKTDEQAAKQPEKSASTKRSRRGRRAGASQDEATDPDDDDSGEDPDASTGGRRRRRRRA
jgi:hypothetical protein